MGRSVGQLRNLVSRRLKLRKWGYLDGCGHVRRDKNLNEDIYMIPVNFLKKKNLNDNIWDEVGVASVVDKEREARLRWFGHVKKRSVDAPIRKCERFAMVGVNTGRGKMKRYWGGD